MLGWEAEIPLVKVVCLVYNDRQGYRCNTVLARVAYWRGDKRDQLLSDELGSRKNRTKQSDDEWFMLTGMLKYSLSYCRYENNGNDNGNAQAPSLCVEVHVSQRW